MTPEQWRAVDALFHDAADLPASERGTLLAAADAEIRHEVEKLLAADDEGAGLVSAAVEQGQALLEQAAPQRFGPWRVTGILGQGSMGTVFLAVRDDEAFEKRVAIKTVHVGFAAAAVDRFRQERNILARLEHPNIARLLDGGETPGGQAYLAMEYVEGEDIVSFAEKRKLNREARLRLFLQVCAAVQYAHQNLIVHRDIKPGNIMVSTDGVSKLLDFGIARFIDTDDARTLTQFRAFTPSYASPEQVRGEPVMVASDIYSLGVLLYELLTSRRPYHLKTTTAIELERVICQGEPEPPRVSADLDVIVLMAMRKEPERRYRTVLELSEDIERALTLRPLRARMDTVWYRTRRYLRRNAWGVAAGVALVASLAGGLANSEYQRRNAEFRFQQVRKLARSFLFDFDKEIRQVPGTTKAREMLVGTALEYLDSLAKGARDPGLRLELVEAYQKVGDVQGMTGLPNLGRPADALASYRKALEIARGLNAAALGKPEYSRALAMTLERLSFLERANGDTAGARRSLEEGIRVAGEGMRGRDPQPADLRLMANGYTYLGSLERGQGRAPQALAAARGGLEWMQRYAAAEPGIRAASDLVRAMVGVGRQQIVAGDLDGARTTLLDVRRRREEIARGAPNDTENLREWATLDHFLGNLHGEAVGPNLRKPDEARRFYQESIDLLERLARADANNVNARHDLAGAYGKLADLTREKDPAAALPLYRRALEFAAAAGSRSLEATWKMSMSHAMRASGDVAGARRNAEQALAVGRKLTGEDKGPEASRWLARYWCAAGLAALAAGDRVAARERLSQAVAILTPHEELARTNLELAVDLANAWEGLEPFQPDLHAHRQTFWKQWAATRPNVYTLWQAGRGAKP